MNRRNYLAGSTACALAFLSGCLGTVGLGYEGDDATIPEPEDPVDAEIRGAVGALNRAGLSLQGLNENLDDLDTAEYEPERPRERIELAYTHLEAAEETGDRLEDVETLHAFTDTIERIIDVTVSLTGVDLETEHEKAETELEEERFDDARSTVQARNASVGNDKQRLEPALDTLETVDRDRLEELNAIDVEPVGDGMRTLDHLLTGLDALTGSLESLIDGSEHLENGRQHFEEGMEATERIDDANTPREAEDAQRDADAAFDDAASECQNAKAAFADSTETLEGVDDPPTSLTEQFETTRCRSMTLEDAAAKFVAGTDAALEDDIDTAREYEQAGLGLIDAAENCGGN